MKQRKDGRWCRSVKIDNKRVFFYSLEKTEKKAAKDIERQMIEYSQKEQKTKLFETVADNWYEELCHPSKNRHKKAPKNEMNRSISLIYENRPHLFHGLLDNEPLPV